MLYSIILGVFLVLGGAILGILGLGLWLIYQTERLS